MVWHWRECDTEKQAGICTGREAHSALARSARRFGRGGSEHGQVVDPAGLSFLFPLSEALASRLRVAPRHARGADMLISNTPAIVVIISIREERQCVFVCQSETVCYMERLRVHEIPSPRCLYPQLTALSATIRNTPAAFGPLYRTPATLSSDLAGPS